MCGIAAILGFTDVKVNKEALKLMSDSIVHRGPDDEGFYIDGPVGFAFRRLSILDLSAAGHQPMESSDGQYTIIFNGEIYNYIELRTELEKYGHIFRSTGDTEVLLHSYIQWGSECLSRLNGMWAFMIHDKIRNLVFGSRDRFGVKPLYIYNSNGNYFFASEIKAIRASGFYSRSPNWSQIARFLYGGRLNDAADTSFTEIRQIPAGSAFEISYDGTMRIWKYWSIPIHTTINTQDAADTFKSIFLDSIRIRLRSDVPLAVFLSGGLDSTSIICAIASQRSRNSSEGTQPLSAFSYISDQYDESQYISDTISKTGADLIPIAAKPTDLWDSLPQVLWYHDEPIHSATALVGYALAKNTSRHGIKVVLNGQGADEALAGYPSYFWDYWLSLLYRGHLLTVVSEIKDYTKSQKQKLSPIYRNLLNRFLRSQMRCFSPYRKLALRRRIHIINNNNWYTEDFKRYLHSVPTSEPKNSLSEVLRDSVEVDPLPLYLRIEDRNSMANSLEVRLPFLDYRLVTYAFSLPDELKLSGPWNKYILRQAMKGLIPNSVYTRTDKMGFPTPLASWVNGPLKEPIQEVIHSQGMKERGIFNVENIQKALNKHKEDMDANAAAIFDAVQIELWSKIATKDYSPNITS